MGRLGKFIDSLDDKELLRNGLKNRFSDFDSNNTVFSGYGCLLQCMTKDIFAWSDNRFNDSKIVEVLKDNVIYTVLRKAAIYSYYDSFLNWFGRRIYGIDLYICYMDQNKHNPNLIYYKKLNRMLKARIQKRLMVLEAESGSIVEKSPILVKEQEHSIA